MAKLVFEPPTKQTPGYPRRMRQALELRQRIEGNLEPELVDILIDFLLPYVSEPKGKEAAREALLDASQEQFDSMLAAVQGGREAYPPA